MAVRTSDSVTLAVLPSPSYVRQYFLLQASTLNPPPKPTTDPPPAPWTATEPSYTPASTDTLYTTLITVYGTVSFDYGDVQKSSSYEAAKQAYNLAAQANGTASTALSTANNKNTVVYSTAVATGTGYKAGDVWFRTSGTTIIGQWEFTTSWQSRTLDNALIANLDAGKINAGTLNAARIGANTIAASKLLLSDFTNLFEAPDFEHYADGAVPTNMSGSNVRVKNISGFGSGNGTNRALEVDAMSGGNRDAYFGDLIPVREGDQFLVQFEGRYLNTAGTGRGAAGFRTYSPVKVGTDWTTVAVMPITGKPTAFATYAGTYTVPAGVAYVQHWVTFSNNAETTNKAYFDNFIVRRMNGGELIVDGAITAGKIATNAVTADKIEANAVTAAKIKGDAIDGKTITGAIVRTGATGARVELDATGLHAFDGTGSEVSTISASTGKITALGTFATASSGERAELGGTGLKFVGSFGNQTSVTPFDDGGSGGGGITVAAPFGSLTVGKTNLPLGGSATVATDSLYVSQALTVESIRQPVTLVERSGTASNLPSGWTLLNNAALWNNITQGTGFPAGTAGTIVIPASGHYTIDAGLFLTGTVGLLLAVKLNSTSLDTTGSIAMSQTTGFAGLTSTSVSRSLYLQTGDVLRLATYTTAVSTMALSPSTATYFSAARVA